MSPRANTVDKDLQAAALARGATVRDCGGGHYHIVGRLLVNYYPFSKSRSAYVAGTKCAKAQVSPTEAVDMAFSAPPVVGRDKRDLHENRTEKRRRVRKELIRRDGDKCHWCQTVVTLDTSSIDHVIPLARGGLDNANNRVLSCRPCNKARGHEMPELTK